MKTRVWAKSALLVAACAVVTVVNAARAADTDAFSPREFLEALRVRDARFDNCTLHFTRRETKRMAYELSLGVGYSKWLQEISELEQTDEGWAATGSMQLFGVDRTTCELELDDDLIVRTADIYCVVGPDGATRERRFEFSSSDVLEDSEGPLLAAAGSFRETTVIAVVSGISQEVNRPGDVWEIEAGPVEFDLSNERYSELTRIDEDAADHVIDRRSR